MALSVAFFGTVNSIASTNSLIYSPTPTDIPAGTMLVVLVAATNSGTGGAGNLSLLVSAYFPLSGVSPLLSATYDPGSAGEGATLGIYAHTLESTMPSGESFTVAFNGAANQKVLNAYTITPDPGYVVVPVTSLASAGGLLNSHAAPTVGVNSGDVIFGVASIETDDAVTGMGAPWSAIVRNLADAGVDASAMTVASQYEIAAATGDRTWAGATATARDSISGYAVFTQIPIPPPESNNKNQPRISNRIGIGL